MRGWLWGGISERFKKFVSRFTSAIAMSKVRVSQIHQKKTLSQNILSGTIGILVLDGACRVFPVPPSEK